MNIKTKVKISKIFFLENFKEKLIKLDPNTAFKKLLLINRVEFRNFPEIIMKYIYLNKNLDFRSFLEKEEDLIKNIIQNSISYQINYIDPQKYSEMIFKILSFNNVFNPTKNSIK